MDTASQVPLHAGCDQGRAAAHGALSDADLALLRLACEAQPEPPHDRLQLLYQPLADLRGGAAVSLEALLQWRQPDQSWLPGHQFLPQAETAGISQTIGRWALRRACRDMQAWQEAGLTLLPVALNLSPQQFNDPGFGAATAELLAGHGLTPAVLTLNIAETALQQAGAAADSRLVALKALGLALTLDGFGNGHSSLASLTRFHFETLKIDCSLILDLPADSHHAAIVKAVIAMAHQLGMKVAAEGVETESQCDFLRRNMCDQIQGDFFSLPLATHEVTELLQQRPVLPPHLLRFQQRQRRLLLVDDEPNIVAALKRLLRADHYQVYSANSGAEGLDLLALHPVDVIVSDQRMPGMLGADFLRKAKQLYPDTIRIMLSGYTELQSVTDAVNEGAIYKFLTKPWEDDLLRGHIADAFRLKEIADENERLNLEVRSANQELAAANRRMEQLLQEKQRQISRDEISLNVARELLQHLPLPVLGLDDGGMIAFINGAAEALFRHSGALLGNEARELLPELFSEQAQVDGQRYHVVHYPMGEQSSSRGSLVTLSRHQEQP